MPNIPDPSFHRLREQQFLQHAIELLDDPSLRVDTVSGRRPVVGLLRDVNRSDHSVDLKRMMIEANKPDRAMEANMPQGEVLDVLLSKRAWMVLRKPVARLQVICASPTHALVHGQDPAPMTPADIQKIVNASPSSSGRVPRTIVLMSTSGFTAQAHELADRQANRMLVLVEPNESGGWTIWGPAEMADFSERFDPEKVEQKRLRLREAVDQLRSDLSASGITSSRLADRTGLPIHWIEDQLKQVAKDEPGLIARRIDGKLTLFSQGSASLATLAAGGSTMSWRDRIISRITGKDDPQKKIADLSQRRTALSQQRDKVYESIEAMEARDTELRQQFKDASAVSIKRRITTQLVQLGKDMERERQSLNVLNQQINVVHTHLHNIELVQQGKVAKLPTSQEIAEQADEAEQMLARLQADSELADEASGMVQSSGGLSEQEQALYDELEQEAADQARTDAQAVEVDTSAQKQRISSAANKVDDVSPQADSDGSVVRRPESNEPEAGA